jgi:hypothetical protein
MAISIRPTPVLEGTEAKDFLRKVEAKKSERIDFREQKAKAERILAKSFKHKGENRS